MPYSVPTPRPLDTSLVLSGATIGLGAVIGWLAYALQAPSVITLDAGTMALRGPLIHRKVSTAQIQEVVRGWTGRGGMRAYRFVSGKGSWLVLGDIVIIASQYDPAAIEALIAATGKPVTGDFTERV